MARNVQNLGLGLAQGQARMSLEQQQRAERQRLVAQALGQIRAGNQQAANVGMQMQQLEAVAARQAAAQKAQQQMLREREDARSRVAQQQLMAKRQAAEAKRRQADADALRNARLQKLAEQAARGEDTTQGRQGLAAELGMPVDVVDARVSDLARGIKKDISAEKTSAARGQKQDTERLLKIAEGIVTNGGTHEDLRQAVRGAAEFDLTDAEVDAIVQRGEAAAGKTSDEVARRQIAIAQGREVKGTERRKVLDAAMTVTDGKVLLGKIKEAGANGEWDQSKLSRLKGLANKINLPPSQAIQISTGASGLGFGIDAGVAGGNYDEGAKAAQQLDEEIRKLDEPQKSTVMGILKYLRSKMNVSEAGVPTDKDWAFYRDNVIAMFDEPDVFVQTFNDSVRRDARQLHAELSTMKERDPGPFVTKVHDETYREAYTEGDYGLTLDDVPSGGSNGQAKLDVPPVPSISRAADSGVQAIVGMAEKGLGGDDGGEGGSIFGLKLPSISPTAVMGSKQMRAREIESEISRLQGRQVTKELEAMKLQSSGDLKGAQRARKEKGALIDEEMVLKRERQSLGI